MNFFRFALAFYNLVFILCSFFRKNDIILPIYYNEVFIIMKNIQNKWIRGAIPALLLHCSIGTVYCWSMFSQEIANYIGFSKGAVEWAFSFAIFFLGMSAAFLGGLVEKNIHKSSLIASIAFALGMAGTGFFIWYGGRCLQAGNPSVLALIGIYVSYGFIMGIGLGTGYLSPVKTLMLWFKDKKGLATGLAVAGFGAAKAIASPIMQAILDKMGREGIYKMFYILALVYFVMMMVGHFMLAKPEGWVEPQKRTKENGILASLKVEPLSSYIGIWLMFYINITCGLAIISQEKMIVKCVGLGSIAGYISTISALFNAGGRLGFSALADQMKDRNTVYKIIFALSIGFTLVVLFTGGIARGGRKHCLDFVRASAHLHCERRLWWRILKRSDSSFGSLWHGQYFCNPRNHSFSMGFCRSFGKSARFFYRKSHGSVC